jgi:hypothetical protein
MATCTGYGIENGGESGTQRTGHEIKDGGKGGTVRTGHKMEDGKEGEGESLKCCSVIGGYRRSYLAVFSSKVQAFTSFFAYHAASLSRSYKVFDIESESPTGVGLLKSQISRNATLTQCGSLAYHSIFAIFPARSQRLMKSGHFGSLK